MPMHGMYPPLLDAACRQSRAGIRDALIHDDTEVEIHVLPDGYVQVKLFIGRAGSLHDWAAVCGMRAARNAIVTNAVTRIITFRPR